MWLRFSPEKNPRKRLLIPVLAGVLLAGLMVARPAAAIEPHVNPATTPQIYDGPSLLRKYTEALDLTLARDPDGIGPLQEQATIAHIQDDLRDTVAGFLSSSESLAGLIAEIELDIASSSSLLALFRVEESRAIVNGATDKLLLAYSQLGAVQDLVGTTADGLLVEASPEDSALRDAYDEVQSHLQSLQNLLDLYNDMLNSQSDQIDFLAGNTSSNPPDPSDPSNPLRDTFLPTTLTLTVAPEQAFVGDTVAVRGRLSSEDAPLGTRTVTILLNGAPVSEFSTGADGSYSGGISLPYSYVPEMKARAIFFPEGDDIGRYLGSSSPDVSIEVLYYETVLDLQAPASAYPGLELAVTGNLDYATAPEPPERDLLIYLDDRQLAEEKGVDSFDLKLMAPNDTSTGTHQLTVYVPPFERFAPAEAGRDIEVAKITPVIEMDTPGVVFLPFTQTIKGKIYSQLGPAASAPVEVSLGDWEGAVLTRPDGTFEVNLDTGLSLSLVGSQPLQVNVTPAEPWHDKASTSATLMVINPVNIGGLLLAAIALSFLGIRWWRRQPAVSPATPSLSPPAAPLVEPEKPSPAFNDVISSRGGPAAALLGLYRAVLRLVQAVTSLALPSNQTLREFSRECAPRLGPLGRYFQEFTLMIERLLYSGRQPGEADVSRGEEISRIFAEGVEGEKGP